MIFSGRLYNSELLHASRPSILMRSTTPQSDDMPLSTLVLECANLTAVVRLGPGEAAIFLPGRYIVASQQRATPGAKYAEAGVLLWLKGDDALLTIGDPTQHCINNRHAAIWQDAKLSGILFRAIGHVLSWVLTIDQSHLSFSFNDAQSQLEIAMYGAVVNKVKGRGHYSFEFNGKPFLLDISTKNCIDSITGEAFESSVIIYFDDNQFIGCGKTLN